MTVLAYLGPETMLPMTSVIAGALGFFMMFGRKAIDLARAPFRKKPAVVAPKTRARGHRPATSRNVDLVAPGVEAEPTEAAE